MEQTRKEYRRKLSPCNRTWKSNKISCARVHCIWNKKKTPKNKSGCLAIGNEISHHFKCESYECACAYTMHIYQHFNTHTHTHTQSDVYKIFHAYERMIQIHKYVCIHTNSIHENSVYEIRSSWEILLFVCRRFFCICPCLP